MKVKMLSHKKKRIQKGGKERVNEITANEWRTVKQEQEQAEPQTECGGKRSQRERACSSGVCLCVLAFLSVCIRLSLRLRACVCTYRLAIKEARGGSAVCDERVLVRERAKGVQRGAWRGPSAIDLAE